MVDVIGRAKVIITGDVDSRSIDDAGGKIGRSLKAGAVVGVAALGTVAAAGFKAFQSFEDAEAQTRKLTNVLDNMGKSAAAPAVEDLATELSRLTGIGDDVIQQGQTILATFSEVAESAGETGGTFERATKAAVDLSATGFGSVESASVMLGKALQDPIKGITALSRSGVTFTEEQKKVIESLVETGRVGEAQALILEEVEKQVGGTAEESATASQKIKNAMGEAGEALGNVIDTLLGGKNEPGGGKSLDLLINDVTDSLNEFAESEGFKEFTRNLEEAGFGDWLQRQSDIGNESLGTLLLEFSRLPKRLDAIKADIEDGGLWDGVSNQFEEAERKVGAGLRRMKGRISDFITDVAGTAGDWQATGRKLITNFFNGLGTRVSGKVGDIVQGLKNALNSSLGLPRTINIPLAPDVRIPAFAQGVRNFAGGLALVGERGPELVGLPRGSDVYSNRESAAMVSGGDTINNYWNFYGPESLSKARRDETWARTTGTRFGAATSAGV